MPTIEMKLRVHNVKQILINPTNMLILCVCACFSLSLFYFCSPLSLCIKIQMTLTQKVCSRILSERMNEQAKWVYKINKKDVETKISYICYI